MNNSDCQYGFIASSFPVNAIHV